MGRHIDIELWLSDPQVSAILSGVFRTSDPQANAALSGVLRTNRVTYFRRTQDGRDVLAPITKELKSIGVPSTMVSRLIAEHVFPTAEFRHNRKRHGAYLTGAEMTARDERRALRLARAAEKAMQQQSMDHTTEATAAIAEIEEESLEDGANEDCEDDTPVQRKKRLCRAVVERKAAEAERRFNRRFQIEKRSSGAWGVYDADLNSTRLTGHSKQSALDELALMRVERRLACVGSN